MKNIAYYNGAIGTTEELSIPFADRVCFFGDGVYDATYSRNGIIFALEEHVDRLFFSAAHANIIPNISPKDLYNLTNKLVNQCSEKENFVYIQFTRGISIPRNHIDSVGRSNLWINITPKSITPKDKTIKLATFQDKRYDYCFIKTLNLLPNVMAANYAKQKNCDEALFVQNGMVNECAHSNIHILLNGAIISPPAGERVLGGIARRHLIAACKKANIAVEERHFSIDELKHAEAVYISSAGTFLAPCISLDDEPIGGGGFAVTRQLQSILYNEFYEQTKL